jgi:hypothetical protein
VPLSDVPNRRWHREYTPYTTTLPLEPYQVPDLTIVGNPHPITSGPTAPPTGPLTASGHQGAGGNAAALDDTTSQVSSAPFRDLESASNVGTDMDHATQPPQPPTEAPAGAQQPAPAALPGVSTLLRGASLPHAVNGNVTVTVYTPNPAYTMCGWLLKKSDTWMIGGSYRPYWFVLMNGEFQYFQQVPHATVLSLDQPKKLLLCQNITQITYKHGVISVHYKQRGVKGVWQMKSDPEHPPPARMHFRTPVSSAPPSPVLSPSNFERTEPPPLTPPDLTKLKEMKEKEALHPLPPVTPAMIERMWVRKLTRCSPNVPDPDLKAASEKRLFPPAGVSTRNLSTKTHTADGLNELVRGFSKDRRPPSLKIG